MKAPVRQSLLFRAIKFASFTIGCCALAVGLTTASGGQVPAQAAGDTGQASQAQIGSASTSMISGVQVQNLSSTSTANIQIAYYNPDGSTAATQSDTIPAGQSKTYFGSTMAAPAGFVGSAVVTSDQQVAAITNLVASNSSTGANLGGEAYDGVATAGNSVNVPLVQWNNGINSATNSTISVQNASSSTSTQISVSFSPASPNYPTITMNPITLQANGSVTINSSMLSGLGSSRWVGSASVSATNGALIAIEVSQADAYNNELLSYTGSTTGSSFVYAPLIETNHSLTYRNFTGFQVQNTSSSSSATVYLYLNSTPATCGDSGYVDSVNLSPLGSKTWYPVPGTTSVSDFVGSATACTPGGALIGAVNEISGTGAQISGQGATYNAFTDASATATVSMPLVENNHSGFYTGQQIQNVGSSPTTVYIYQGGVPASGCGTGSPAGSQLLNPGASKTWYPLPGLAQGPAVSATACVAPGGKIVGIVHEIRPGYAGDNSYLYEGINQ